MFVRETLRHTVRDVRSRFIIVTHSFEMLAKNRIPPNRSVMSWFEALCDYVAKNPGLRSTGFREA